MKLFNESLQGRLPQTTCWATSSASFVSGSTSNVSTVGCYKSLKEMCSYVCKLIRIARMELDIIRSRIHSIRGQKVMLDFDLAELYEVEVRSLNQAVKRNSERFPEDFMFQLDGEEWADLKSQSVISSWGGRRTPPYSFTEQGVSMLSSVLNSAKAIRVNIAIMRAFVMMRQFALSHAELTNQLRELEQRYDRQFSDIFEAIGYLMAGEQRTTELKLRKKIGFKREGEE